MQGQKYLLQSCSTLVLETVLKIYLLSLFWRYKKYICFKSHNCLKNFKLGVHLIFVHVLNFNTAVINYSKCFKSRERKTSSGVEVSALPKCELFTQTVFVKNSILNLPTARNVISNSQSVSVEEIFLIPRSNSSSSSPSSTRNKSVNRGDTTSVINESKRSKLSKPSLDTTDQALLELLRKEDKGNMEVPDADVSFVSSILPILQSLLAKKSCLQK